MNKYFIVSSVLLGAVLSNTAFAADDGRTVSGYKIDVCNPYDEDSTKDHFINFCDQSSINQYKKYGTKDINFRNKYVLFALNDIHYVALNPKTKDVFVLPVAVYSYNSDFTSMQKAQVSFKNGRLCSSGSKTVFFDSYSTFDIGLESTPQANICYEFIEGEGFSSIGTPYNKKTNKPMPLL